jgi:hypothetical protein
MPGKTGGWRALACRRVLRPGNLDLLAGGEARPGEAARLNPRGPSRPAVRDRTDDRLRAGKFMNASSADLRCTLQDERRIPFA